MRGVVGPEFVEDRAHATVAASGSVPPVNAFDSVTISGTISAASHANRVSGAAEAGEDFIKNQQKFITVRSLAQPTQHGGVVKAHAAGTLHQRLDDDPGELVRVTLERARPAVLSSSCGRSMT